MNMAKKYRDETGKEWPELPKTWEACNFLKTENRANNCYLKKLPGNKYQPFGICGKDDCIFMKLLKGVKNK